MGTIGAPKTVTMQEFLSDFRKIALDELTEWRKRSATVRGNKIGEAFVNARIEVWERLNIFAVNAQKEGVIDMEEMKLQVGEIGSLEDLLQDEKGGKIEPAILEISKRLKPNQYERIDDRKDMLAGISWLHFSGRVYRMQKAGRLSTEYGPIKRGTKFYLARYTPEKAKELYEKRLQRKKFRANADRS